MNKRAIKVCAKISAISGAFALLSVGSSAWANECIGSKDVLVDKIAVEHAEIIAPLRGAPMATGYITIWNGTKEAIDISGIRIANADSISLHETIVEQGIAKMRPVSMPRNVPPRSEFVMKSGGYHLMIDAGGKSLNAGETVPLIVEFLSGDKISIDATVRPFGKKSTDHHHGQCDSDS